MAKAIAAIEKIANIKFVEVGGFANEIADFSVEVMDVIPGNVPKGQQIFGKAVFPYFGAPMDRMKLIFKKSILSNDGVSENVFLHELGHLLGLKHPWDGNRDRPFTPAPTPEARNAVTYTIMGYSKTIRELTPADIVALQFLYGAPGQRPDVEELSRQGTAPDPESSIRVDQKPSFFRFVDKTTLGILDGTELIVPLGHYQNWEQHGLLPNSCCLMMVWELKMFGLKRNMKVLGLDIKSKTLILSLGK